MGRQRFPLQPVGLLLSLFFCDRAIPLPFVDRLTHAILAEAIDLVE
jgi:hypothetical protein